MKQFIFSWGALSVSVMFNAVGVFIVKQRLNELGVFPTESIRSMVHYLFLLTKSPPVLFGIFLVFVAPILSAIALSRLDITIAYPALIGLNFLFILILGTLFLGENLTLYKIVGIGLVIASFYFLNKQ